MQLPRFNIPLFKKNGSRLCRQFYGICTTDNFYRSLERERDRADRNGLQFAVVSFDVHAIHYNGYQAELFAKAVCHRTRIADEIGWIDDRHIGLLLFNTDKAGALRLITDVRASLGSGFAFPDYHLYIYPQDNQSLKHGLTDTLPTQKENRRHSINNSANMLSLGLTFSGKTHPSYRPNHLSERMDPCQDIRNLFPRRMPIWKRLLDIAGASMALVIFSPLFVVIPLMIKILSPGPVFFRQERIGFEGRKFVFLKFRSMNHNCDPTVHCQYYAGLIQCDEENAKPMVKLDECNTQIIPFFKLIRKTYLDELPQLINVLRGEMSLVGPRPPIPYEVAEYSRWHNGRFDVVPGMTGLWQTSGKNRLTFKEMVRLDIRYRRKLSLLRDLKILLNTPVVIVSELGSPGRRTLSKKRG